MTGWLKRFFLSLFSDKQAKENLRYGFGNILLTGLLSVAFIFLGIFAGETVPFFAYYQKADGFRGFLYNVFAESGAGITVTVNDGAEITADGKAVLINTFTDEADKQAYFRDGYHLIVDSRNVASVYDDFTPFCSTKDGKEISYGEYLKLSSREQQNYYFSVKYSGKQKVVGADDVAVYTAYFNSLSDGNAKKQFTELTDKKYDMTAEEYNTALYELYVKNYYPDMLRIIGESVPTLRNYYYGLAAKSEGKYFCLFGDMQTASFKSYNGNTVACGGVYRQGNGINAAGLNEEQTRLAIDEFIKGAYYDGLSSAFIFELLNALFLIVITELIIVGAMLLCYAVCRLNKSEVCNTFAKCAKLVSSYAHVAALLAALAAFCMGFVFNGGAVSVTAYVCFAAILIVRTLVLILREKKKTEQVPE